MSDGESSISLGRMFDGMNEKQRQRCQRDLLSKSSAVAKHGWFEYRRIWSQGEVVAVALVLDDTEELVRQFDTKTSALNRWAFDPWGLDAGEIEVKSGCPRTREFFDSLRAVIRGEGCTVVRTTKTDPDGYAQTVHETNRETGY
ncbi:hypothetical protein ACWDTP_16130 [Mycobacterium sp. NPDC003449]